MSFSVSAKEPLPPQQGGQRRECVGLLHMAGYDRSQIPEPEQGRAKNDTFPINDDACTLHILVIGGSGQTFAAAPRKIAQTCAERNAQVPDFRLRNFYSQSRFSVSPCRPSGTTLRAARYATSPSAGLTCRA